MDESAIEIVFDEDGVCNFCKDFKRLLSKRVEKDDNEYSLNKIVEKIIKDGKNKDYDCLIGVSGGVDSTFLAYKVKELGLRPLAVHFDNGWDSELSVINIQNTLQKLDIDLVTNVVDWEEFKDLQKSLLRASTPDGEVPSDHAVTGTLYRTANKFNIKYIITGLNYSDEGLLPKSWSYGHIDWPYLKGLHKKFGSLPIKTYPYYTITNLFYYTFIKRIKRIGLLNYFNFTRDDATKLITNKLGWKQYGWKHHESIYTRFWQAYVLPNKFGIDKRRAHLSNLICSGKIRRDEALLELKKGKYEGHKLEQDMKYVIKKLGYNEEKFQKILDLPVKSFHDYKNNYNYHQKIRILINYLRSKKILFK
tara:strand:+ start:1221 stop:2309 length:1089 start_codon:yes stop_codon:yes gene_type:complete